MWDSSFLNQGLNPRPPALEEWSLNSWTERSPCFVLEGSICDEIFLDNFKIILPVSALDAG